ncbi:MAG: IS4 family transposase [Planctomycetota bacterium]|nr:IS4 family transposase [Planctomycetota bacterium]
MKSGCRAEESRLRTAARLANLIAMMCIVAWRVLWLTMLNRTDPELPATLVLTEVEILLLDRLVAPADDSHRGTVGDVLNRLAGYLNRRHDGPPGHTVLWRGLTRLADIQLGYDLDHSCG